MSAGYGVSWAYLIGDVAYTAWKTRLQKLGLYEQGLMPWSPAPKLSPEQITANKRAARDLDDWQFVATKRAVFQSIASMGLPAFTIHSTVKYAGKAMANVKNQRLRTFGPVGLGLAVVPALPYLFDEPVEHAVDYVFDEGRKLFA